MKSHVRNIERNMQALNPCVSCRIENRSTNLSFAEQITHSVTQVSSYIILVVPLASTVYSQCFHGFSQQTFLWRFVSSTKWWREVF